MGKRWILAVSLVILVGLLAACGGGGAQEPSAPAPSQPTPTAAAAAPAKGDPAAGEKLYASTCAACHGPDARGLPNLGKDLVDSDFVKGLSDQELLAFIKKGRPTSDPANTTGVDMPPKGGNPSLTDQQILDIIAYIRSLQK